MHLTHRDRQKPPQIIDNKKKKKKKIGGSNLSHRLIKITSYQMEDLSIFKFDSYLMIFNYLNIQKYKRTPANILVV